MRKLVLLLLSLLVPIAALAQGPINDSLTAQSSDCSGATGAKACLAITVPREVSSVAVQLTGTFSATVQFEATVGPTWQSIQGTKTSDGTQVTSATAAGIWIFPVSGLAAMRVRASTYSSGAVTVDMRSSNGSPIPLGSSFSGSVSGNAAASAIGAPVPASADNIGVSVGGNTTGVSGTSEGGGTSANVHVTGGVSTGVAQGSTTAGQSVTPVGCGTLTAAPSNTTTQTNVLSCDPAGNLRTTAAISWNNANQVQQPTAANFKATALVTDGTNTVGVAPASTAATGSQPALVVSASPNSFQFSCIANAVHSITTGGTSQTAAAANAARQSITLMNFPDATTQGIGTAETLFYSFNGAASETSGVPTAAQVIPLAPGQSMTFGGGIVTTQALTVNAEHTGHLYGICEQ